MVIPLIIAALYFWLVPEGQHLFNGFRLPRDLHTLTEFKTLLFLYFGFSLVAHMDLSKEDLEIASSGLPVLFIILLLVNIGALLVGYDPTALLRTFGVQAWKFCGPILAVCFVLAILHLFFAWLVLGLIHFLLRQPPVRVLP